MSSTKSKLGLKLRLRLRLMSAFAALLALALAVGCRGFFVKPTLSSISVGPASPTIYTGTTNNTVQMFAVGSFTDGSTGSTSVTWSISPASGVASISAGGLVTAVDTGTATITATSTILPSISGTQSLLVTLGCVNSIALVPTSGSIASPATTFTFTSATASTCSGDFNVLDIATWNSSSTNIATVANGVVTATGNSGADGPVVITASIGTVTSNAVTIQVSGF